MGVLGWTPLTVMQEADLEELADAYEGYARFHGYLPADIFPPQPQFLAQMLEKFPDMKGTCDE